jgi:hypothetical protein
LTGGWFFSAVTSTGITNNIAIVAPASQTIVWGPVSLSATAWAAGQIIYLFFDYVPNSLLI